MWVQWIKVLKNTEAKVFTFMQTNGVPRRTAEQLFGLHTLTDVSASSMQGMTSTVGSLESAVGEFLHPSHLSLVGTALPVTRHPGFRAHTTFVSMQEIKRIQVVWQLRHTLWTLGDNDPARIGPALKDVLVIEVGSTERMSG
jgi:hypothetical protein